MTERQIKALNTLFAATTEVMEAFAPEDVSATQRREALSRMIENFLLSASSPSNGFVYNEVPKSSVSLNASIDNNSFSRDQTLQKTFSGQEPCPDSEAHVNSSSSEKIETRYAISPILMEDGYCFKRLKLEEDRDNNTRYPYIVIIGESSGSFTIEELLDNYQNQPEEFKRTFPEMVVEISQQGKSLNEATKLVTIEPGTVVKDGKNWKITKRVKVIYE